jgi:hypothetical protein
MAPGAAGLPSKRIPSPIAEGGERMRGAVLVTAVALATAGFTAPRAAAADDRRQDGSTSWAPRSGSVVGAGWGGFTGIAPWGGGVVLGRDPAGDLLWNRDTDPLGGTGSWANGGIAVAAGVGWNGGGLIADVTGCTAS